MHPAFETWDIQDESLESVENRIHDGLPRVMLSGRALGYIDTFAALFPWSLPKPGGRIIEIGSGLGYIMQAALQRLNPSGIVGLDVAANMIDKAKQRLARDQAVDERIEFCLYDGVLSPTRTIPAILFIRLPPFSTFQNPTLITCFSRYTGSSSPPGSRIFTRSPTRFSPSSRNCSL